MDTVLILNKTGIQKPTYFFLADFNEYLINL